MHKIYLNEALEIPEKKTPNHLKEKSQIPQKTAGFNTKPKSPLKSLKSFEITKNFEENPKEKPLQKGEIFENLLNLKENTRENRLFLSKKPEIYEDLIEDLENNVEKIRYKRQKLWEKSQKAEKTEENPLGFSNFSENYEKSENFYQEKPSLQNIGTMVDNQRKNLKEIEFL